MLWGQGKFRTNGIDAAFMNIPGVPVHITVQRPAEGNERMR